MPRSAADEVWVNQSPTDEADRFLTHVEVRGEHWFWTGAKSSAGYGNVRVRSRHMTAQRRAWELFRGPLDEYDLLEKDPACRHKLCVNPRHWRKKL